MVEIRINYTVFRALSGKICRPITVEIRGWARATGCSVVADMSVSMRHGETYDRRSHYWPIFHPRTRRHEQLLLHFYWADYKYVPAAWKRVGRRYPWSGEVEGSDRGGADKTTVLCKPRYQCGVNRALTPSAGNQPLPLLPSTSWVFAGLLLEGLVTRPFEEGGREAELWIRCWEWWKKNVVNWRREG